MDVLTRWSCAGGLLALGVTTVVGAEPMDLPAVEAVNGPVVIRTLYDNTGRTLDINATTGNYELRVGGTIRGGTIATRDGMALIVPDGSYNTAYSTLDHVTLSSGSDIRLIGRSCVFLRERLTLNGTMTLDAADGYPVAAPAVRTPLTIAGTGTLRFVGGNAVATGVPAAGFQASSPTTLARGLKVELTGRAYLYGTYVNHADITIDSSGQYVFLGGGSTGATFTNHGTVTLNSGRLTLDGLGGDGFVDIRGGVAIANFAPAANAPTLRERLRTALASNFSTGPLRTSLATTGGIGLGYTASPEPTPNMVVATLFGDADLDGEVSIQDFNRLANGMRFKFTTWYWGDFDYDGGVSINDFNLLAANFGKSMTGASVDIAYEPLLAFAAAHDDLAAFEAVTGVPEPTGLLPLAAGAAAFARRRRRT